MKRNPTFIMELVDPVLEQAIRLVRPRRLEHALRVAQILNVLPRKDIPSVSDVAIMVMPWIDTVLACRIGDVWLLETLHFRLACPPTYRPLHVPEPHGALQKAAEVGHVEVLDWWNSRIGNLSRESDQAILTAACTFGHLPVLEWWLEKAPKKCGWGFAVETAVQRGHFEILDRLHTHGYPFAFLACSRVADTMITYASAKWFIQRESVLRAVPVHVFKEVLIAFLTNADAQVSVLLAMSRDQRRLQDSELMELSSYACVSGDLAFLKHCDQLFPGGIRHPLSYLIASSFGHVHVLDWLFEHGVPNQHTMLSDADLRRLAPTTLATMGVIFSRDRGSFSPFFTAIASGHVHVLDWLVSHSSTPNMKADSRAVAHASAPVLTWLRHHSKVLFAEANVAACLQQASLRKETDVLDWWYQHLDKADFVSRLQCLKLNKAPFTVWKWLAERDLPIYYSDGDFDFWSRSCDKPPSLDMCDWLLERDDFPKWKLPDWIQVIGCNSIDDSFLTWANEKGLIRDMFHTPASWPLPSEGEDDMTWPSLLWWIETMGEKFLARLQDKPVSFSNPLALDYCWAYYGKDASKISVDGDHLTEAHRVSVLDWAVQAGVPIHQKACLKLATLDGNVAMLEWWCKHANQLKPLVPKARSVAKLCQGSKTTWDWWLTSGLLPTEELEEYRDLAFFSDDEDQVSFDSDLGQIGEGLEAEWSD